MVLTLEQIRQDYALYAGTFLRIKSWDLTVKPLILNPAQLVIDYYRKLQESKGLPIRILILKGRQMGVSTYCQGYAFWRVMQPLTSCITIAHDLDSTNRIFGMAKFFYDNLPIELKPMKRYSNRKELVFENPDEKTRDSKPGLRSTIEIRTAGNIGSGKGITINVLHISEIAMYRQPELIGSALMPAVPPTTESAILIESTAHILGYWFREQWDQAKTGQSEFVPIFLPWTMESRYSLTGRTKAEWLERRPLDDYEKELMEIHGLDGGHIAFRRMKIAELQSEDIFRQEFPLTDEEAWITVGNPLIPGEVIRRLETLSMPGVVGEYIGPQLGFVPARDGRLMLWEPPAKGVEYTIGVDTSQGADDSDPSAIQVITSGKQQKQVARWTGRIDPIALAPFIVNLGRWYNEAMVCVETNGTGLMTQRAVQEHGYANLYRWRYLDKIGTGITERIGWYCTAPETPILTADLRWLAAEAVSVGDELFAVDEDAPVKGLQRRLRIGLVEAVDEMLAQRVRVITDQGEITVSDNHPFLVRPYATWGFVWREAHTLRAGDVLKWTGLWDAQGSYEAGRLSAFLDGEGYLVKGAGSEVGISQARGEVADDIVRLFRRLGYEPSIRESTPPRSRTPMLSIGIRDLMRGLRLLGEMRPLRLLRDMRTKWFGRLTIHGLGTARVVAVLPDGHGAVSAIQTSTRTLVTGGFISHNTSSSNKPALVGSFRHVLLSGKLIPRDPSTLAELKTFVSDARGGAQAAPGMHDDLVMALAIASMCDTLASGASGWAYESPQWREQTEIEKLDPRTHDLMPGPHSYPQRDWRTS